jgi:hypothetical protein
MFSWILAATYVICGLIFFRLVTRFSAIYSNLGVPLPALTKFVFFVGPLGWLALAFLGSILVVLKDLRFKSPILNPLFGWMLVLVIGTVVVAIASVFNIDLGIGRP